MDDGTRSRPPEIVGSNAPRLTTTIAPGDTVEEDPERYSIERQIGVGGMGTVLAAKSARFGRPVALKVVTADRDDLRRRFEREAQVTARLQHPAIVPVYGSGHGRDGHPFYAMKQVTGEPLDHAIREATTLAQRLGLLSKVIAVTEAIAYAHSERVIHRDLKPANILVGAFGETVVIDWGLAKDLASSEAEEVAAGPYRTDGGDATAFGKVMGTPAYMPLEQARGEAVDERTDVYALGAILYHVLAGRAPYVRPDESNVPWDTMLARVLSLAPEPLASIEPELAPDLRAIVDRAMAREPADRYATAGELASDLRRFQTGQLVGAHRYSTWQLIRRWVRRHRTPVLVGSVGIVALAVVAIISVRRIVREQEAAESARVLAEQHRAESEDLTNFMLYDMRDKLQSVGRVDLLAVVANKAAGYFEALPETADPKEQSKRATMFENLGDVFLAQGNTAAAREKFQRANQVMLALEVRDHGPQGQFALAITEHKLGNVMYTLGSYDEALRYLRLAQGRLERIIGLGTAKLDWEDRLVNVMYEQVSVLQHQGKRVDARTTADRALAMAKQVEARAPAERRNKWIAAWALKQHADGLLESDAQTALADLQAAKSKIQEVIALDPKDRLRPTAILMSIHRAIGVAYHTQYKYLEAVEAYRAAAAISDARSLEDPTNTEHPADSANAHGMAGKALAARGDGKLALPEFAKSLAIYEALLAKDPGNRGLLRAQLAIIENLGEAKRSLRDYAAANVEYTRALAIAERLVAEDPNSVEDQLAVAIIHANLGDNYDEQGDGVHALEEHRASLAMRRALAQKDPSDPDRQHAIWLGELSIGDVLKKYKQTVAAEQACDRAIAALKPLLAKFPTNAQLQRELQSTHQRRADMLLVNHKEAEGLALARQTLAWFEAQLRAEDSDLARADVASLQQTVGDALVATGDRAGAQHLYRAALVTIDALLVKSPRKQLYLTDRADLHRKLRR